MVQEPGFRGMSKSELMRMLIRLGLHEAWIAERIETEGKIKMEGEKDEADNYGDTGGD